MILDIQALRCDGCPANSLKDKKGYGPSGDRKWFDWVSYCERLREKEAKVITKIHGKIKLYILTESIPSNRFIYDLDSRYDQGGLRRDLCRELLGIDGDCGARLIAFLREKGILIVDCALCPLHKLGEKKYRRHAATMCLSNNTHKYLDKSPNAPIITIFPSRSGFLKSQVHFNITRRIARDGEFSFKNITGLRAKIHEILRSLDPKDSNDNHRYS